MTQNIKSTVLIIHATDRKVFVLEKDQKLVLPQVEGGPTNDEMVGPLQQAVQQQLGLYVAIGRQLYKKKDDQSIEYIYEAQFLNEDLNDSKVEWIGEENVQLISLAEEEYKPVLEKWLSEKQIPETRAKWFQFNYYNRVEDWVRSEVEKAGLSLTGNMEQVKASDFCLIQRVPTNKGDLYFKATGFAAKHEGVLSKHMDEKYPGKSVGVFATHETESWFLMRDVEGEALRALKDKELWQRAIREYAELQIAELEDVDKLLQIGVPDRRMPALKEEIRQHLAGMCATGLSAEETEQVMGLLPELMEMCDELDSILPASIEHGDLHSNNMRLVRGDLVFFDWGDACVSHPFFSTRVFWNSLDDLIEGEWTESKWLEMVDEFRPYYLAPWTKFAPIEKLERALRISDELGCVQRALSWYLYLTPNRENKAESYKRPSQWLQVFLEHRTLVGK